MRITFIFIIASGLLILVSCGNSNVERYDAAAEQLCDCMNAKDEGFKMEKIKPDTTFKGLNIYGLNYSVCVLTLSEKVDIRDEQMVTSIKSLCPELIEKHGEYVKNL